MPDEAKDFTLETLQFAKPVETDRENKAVSVLLAHIVSTRGSGNVVADKDMDYPRDWKSNPGKSGSTGNQAGGRTVALHSLAVAPKLHGAGLGKLILKDYIQRINDSGTADRVALICQDVSSPHYGQGYGATSC